MNRFKAWLTCLLAAGCTAALSAATWLGRSNEISIAERRKLAQLPKLSTEAILNGSFMDKFESYAQDQFVQRESFRQLKSLMTLDIFRQGDIHDIYIADGYAAEISYELDEASIKHAANRFKYVYEKYLKDKEMNIYSCIVPDKSHYLAQKKGYPEIDFNELSSLLESRMPYAELISIEDLLSNECYYRTDSHWRQDRLEPVAGRLVCRMLSGKNGLKTEELDKTGIEKAEYEKRLVTDDFCGVYAGRAALALKTESMYYLTNRAIENASVASAESGRLSGVYDAEALNNKDAYDFFLSGAQAVLEIQNDRAENDQKLIVLRDSFASSLVPLLIPYYSKITVIDLRYAASTALSTVVDFTELEGADVLFIHSEALINSSAAIK